MKQPDEVMLFLHLSLLPDSAAPSPKATKPSSLSVNGSQKGLSCTENEYATARTIFVFYKSFGDQYLLADFAHARLVIDIAV
jgi:hypothetical protein